METRLEDIMARWNYLYKSSVLRGKEGRDIQVWDRTQLVLTLGRKYVSSTGSVGSLWGLTEGDITWYAQDQHTTRVQ